MKRKKLGLVHTSATLVPVFAQLCKEKLPNVDVFNIADDSLVKGIREAGSLTATIARRVAGYLESAELAGADYIITYFPRVAYDHTMLERFAAEVMPGFG